LSEQRIQQEIRLAISKGHTRIFRNNTGTLRDANGRPVQFGLARGSADLIGWTTRTVTPEMVGQRIAVFTSIEVKTPTGKVQPEQQQWLEAVQAAGGIAGIARSVEDAKALLTAQPDGVPSASHQQQAEQT
jgi:hypothetical protein